MSVSPGQYVQEGIRIANDFELKKVELYPYNGGEPIDLTNVRITINIFEDIFNNFIFGNISYYDTWDLTMLYPIIGEEVLKISFVRPGTKPQDLSGHYNNSHNRQVQVIDETEEYALKFRVFKLSERQITSDKKQYYTLHFCSPEIIANKKLKVRKTYKKKLFSKIVGDIYARYLSKGKPIEIETTKYEQDYIIPCQLPAQAINIIGSRAIAKGRAGSNYVFFETLKGFQFVTLEKLFDADPVETFLYQWHNTYLNQLNRPIAEDVRTISDYEFSGSFDVLENMSTGMYASKLLTYDLVRQRYFEYDYDYLKEFDKTKHLDPHRICTDKLDALGEPYMSRFSFYNTNKDHDKIPWIAGREPGIMPTHIEEVLQQRHALLQQIHNTKIGLTIPGNTARHAGQTIFFALPNAMSDVKNYGNELEKYMSGKYLIAAIRHRIERNGYYNDIELVKDSIVNPIEYTDPVPIYKNTW